VKLLSDGLHPVGSPKAIEFFYKWALRLRATKDFFSMKIRPDSLERRAVKRQAPSRQNLTHLLLTLGLLLGAGTPVYAQTDVLMQHNDISRTGQNTNETLLTPSNVNSSTFGKLFSHAVDGYVYAQPLYVAGVTLGSGTSQAGTTHNVFFIATENDSVYAFDADSNGGADSSPLWQASMISSAHGAGSGEKPMPNSDVSTSDIVPQIGITSTPVIDISTNTIYVLAKSTVADSTFIQRLHALDITTGQEKFGGPMALAASVLGTGNGSSGGTLNWDPKWQNNRASLLLLNGIVYIGFGSHGDNGPWHGWILAYNATTLEQTSAYCTTPNGAGSGIWGAGSGLAADVVDPVNHPFGRMFVSTGNGSYDATTPYTNNMDFGDDHIRLDLTNGVTTVQDSFTPSNEAALDAADEDVGSGGILLLPDQTSGGHTHLLVQAGKEGKIYLIDRDTMGGFNANSDNAVQEIPIQTGGLWSMPAYWNNFVYFWGRANNLQAFTLTAGKLSATPVATGADTVVFPGATPSISSNGTTNGIVWALQTDAFGTNGAAILRAYNATNIATELYNSNQEASRDAAGGAVKFAVPTVTNGKVYVGAEAEVDVYGLLAGSPTVTAPAISPASESFAGSVSVSITDSTNGATIYYTTDGSTPTTSSLQYSGPISVSTTETISAVGSATGFLTSSVAQQTFTLQTQTLMPTFSPVAGSYSAAQTVTISDATPGAKIYFTTDTTTPVPNAGTTQLYSAPLSVGTTTTINAIATSGSLSNSPVSSSTFAIILGASGVNFSNGFSASASAMTFNGSTDLDDTRLQLTSGVPNQVGSAFYTMPLNIQTFTTDFTMQSSNPVADGLTFTIQGNGPTALGPGGGGLGYGPDEPTNPDPSTNAPIGNSVAVKFDFFDNAGEGPDSTGLYTDGASPTVPAIDLTPSGINLHSGDTMSVHLQYDGTKLTMIITDNIANATFTNVWPVNIPSLVGGNTAYVGFTAATGGSTSSQKIETWTFTSTTSTQSAGTPLISPASGTYTLPVSVTLSDTTANASIYYTLDGTVPTTSSALYTGPVALTGPNTVKAFATANAFAASSVASNTYAIQAATPIFSPGPGTYATPQEVTITDVTAGSTIFYTLDGTAPTTSSTQYTGAISVKTSETVKAIAILNGLSNSAVATSAYTIGASDFSMSAGSASLTVAAGGAGTDLITVSPQGGAFPNPVQLTCAVTGPAPLATCSLSPTSVTPGTQPATSMLTITASAASLTPAPTNHSPLSRWIYILALCLALLAIFAKVKTAQPEAASLRRYASGRAYAWLTCVLLVALWQSSCGGGSSGNSAPRDSSSSSTYTVTVTGAASSGASALQHTAQLTVTVP
jgi:hypothetical protein